MKFAAWESDDRYAGVPLEWLLEHDATMSEA
jgi:hypothetical protein